MSDDAPAEPRVICQACRYPRPASAAMRDEACPECGAMATWPARRPGDGWRYRSQRTLAGRPLLAISWGPYGRERAGVARGIVATGDRAHGLVAVGTNATGGLAVGALARGVVAFGGLSLGVIGGGLLAIGGLAVGWLGIGYLAKGSAAIGCYAGGGAVAARFARVGDGPIPGDLPAFVADLGWLFRSWPAGILVPLVVASVVVPVGTAGISLWLRIRGRGRPGRHCPAAGKP
ncbi:MAG: hypothetical protein AB8G96_09040 [Phycisphaerales bacterium]